MVKDALVPTGKVKWYDPEKGFGFLSRDDGDDVFIHRGALPSGVTELAPGTRVDFGIVAGRKGDQALSVKVLDPLPSLSKGAHPRGGEQQYSPDELHGMVDDVIKVLESKIQPELRRGKRPDRRIARSVSGMLHKIAQGL